MNVGAVKNGERITVVLAKAVFQFLVVQVEAQVLVAAACISVGTRATVTQYGKRCREKSYDQ